MKPTRGERPPSQPHYPAADIVADAIDGLREMVNARFCELMELLRQDGSGALARIESKLNVIIHKEEQQMALGQDILDKVTAQTTLIDGVRVLIQGLVASGTIPTEVASAILAKLGENQAQLEAALADGVIPPTA